VSEERMEECRRYIRRHPESEAYREFCKLPLDERHPSMRDLPYVPA
jgi:hypothetical protein